VITPKAAQREKCEVRETCSGDCSYFMSPLNASGGDL
jgi:hypothetical protein